MGFSIVELLVVIGVLSILIAITIPVIAGIRRDARRTQCVTSLRTIGIAYMSYAADNQGYWPMAEHHYLDSAGLSQRRTWEDFIAPYLSTGAHGDARETRRRILRGCPVKSDETPNELCYGMNVYTFSPYPYTRRARYLVNGYRGVALRMTDSTVRSAGGWYFRASQWTNPSARCLLAESSSTFLSIGRPRGNARLDTGNLSVGRHDKPNSTARQVNVLFCDGHVASVTQEEAVRSVRMETNLITRP